MFQQHKTTSNYKKEQIMFAIQTRSLVSLSIFFIFIVMLLTSILMFIQSHNTSIAITHTIVGLGLLLMLIFHVKNNIKALFNYFKIKLNPASKKYNLTMPVALICISSLVVLSLAQFTPFLSFYNWGNTIRATDGQAITASEEITFKVVQMDSHTSGGTQLNIELKKGPYFLWPQYAIWLETLAGEFVQPIYVTKAIAKNQFTNKVTRKDKRVFNSHLIIEQGAIIDELFEFGEDPKTKDTRIRSESLPVFLHKLGSKTSDGLFAPTNGELISDAFTGATMSDNFELKAKTQESLNGKYKLRFEINHSFDFNSYYSSDRFPEDLIYSGSGYSAQPSVIYEAIIDTNDKNALYNMQLIGRGHHSGKNGEIYKDLSNMTTALELVERIRVEVLASK